MYSGSGSSATAIAPPPPPTITTTTTTTSVSVVHCCCCASYIHYAYDDESMISRSGCLRVRSGTTRHGRLPMRRYIAQHLVPRDAVVVLHVTFSAAQRSITLISSLNYLDHRCVCLRGAGRLCCERIILVRAFSGSALGDVSERLG